jgi:hypothetical protein
MASAKREAQRSAKVLLKLIYIITCFSCKMPPKKHLKNQLSTDSLFKRVISDSESSEETSSSNRLVIHQIKKNCPNNWPLFSHHVCFPEKLYLSFSGKWSAFSGFQGTWFQNFPSPGMSPNPPRMLAPSVLVQWTGKVQILAKPLDPDCKIFCAHFLCFLYIYY